MTTPVRRQDPQPIGRDGEVALICLAGMLLVLALVAVAGMGLAAALFGGGWFWPDGGTPVLGHALGGLLTGHPGQGLPAVQARRLPAAATVYGVVGAVEVLVITIAVTGLVLWLRYRRPNDARRGMATRAEAEQALGVSQLRRARPIIRPDLTGRRGTRGGVERSHGRGGGRGKGRARRGVDAEVVARERTQALVAAAPLEAAGPLPVEHAAPGRRFTPGDVGWRLGRSQSPRGVELHVRYDRTTGVYGEQGSGKTLDLLAPALLAHDGAALATLTKLDDLLLTAGRRAAGGRPIAVLDPFGAAPGLPEFVWDPVAGCVDPKVAEKRAKAFAAGTITGAVSGGRQDSAAQFYAAETAKVLQGFLHAAALTGATLDHILEWVASPTAAKAPMNILARHPHATKFWDGLLGGALTGSADTVGNTVTTVQQAMGLFFQPEIRTRCVPTPGRQATDIAGLIARHGTIYLLGREDPYASAAPLMTAIAEHVLDTALWMATTSPHGRMTPSFLACLDELPSTTPLPTLRVRMANERALGLSFIYASQTWRQMVVSYGEDEARSLFGLTNNLVIFGGGKDIHFYRELSDLMDDVRVDRNTYSDGPGGGGVSRAGEDVKVLRPGDIRRIPDKHALVIAGNAPPIIARLRRCLDGPDGAVLKDELEQARAAVATARAEIVPLPERTRQAVAYARAHHLGPTAPDPDLAFDDTAEHASAGRADGAYDREDPDAAAVGTATVDTYASPAGGVVSAVSDVSSWWRSAGPVAEPAMEPVRERVAGPVGEPAGEWSWC